MPGTSDRSERWAGGFVRIVGVGPTKQRVYVIRKQVGGQRYEVSTRRNSEVEALLELAKFQQSPATYDPTPSPDLLGDEGPRPVYLDSDLIKEYLDHCTKIGTSHQWWNAKRRFLGWWLGKLHGVDLRRADLKRDILTPLARMPSRQHRIAVIKAFYAEMRDAENGKGIFTASEDPTLSTLKVPNRPPAQQARRRVFAIEDLERVKKELVDGPRWRLYAIEVLSGTGWHYSEVRRFAANGSVESLPTSQQPKKQKGKLPAGAPVAVLVTVHKGGSIHKTAGSANVLAAAKRIRKLRHLPEFHFHLVLRQISRKLKLKVPVTPGSFRHTVGHEAWERGATPEAVSAFLGHRSPQTTRRFYATLAVAPKVPTLA